MVLLVFVEKSTSRVVTTSESIINGLEIKQPDYQRVLPRRDNPDFRQRSWRAHPKAIIDLEVYCPERELQDSGWLCPAGFGRYQFFLDNLNLIRTDSNEARVTVAAAVCGQGGLLQWLLLQVQR